MRVVTFVVSRTFGSLGAQAQTLIEDIGRRTHLFLCLLSLLNAHEASWATMSITSLDQLLLSKSVNVLQSFSVNIFQMTSSPLLLKPP